MQNHDPHHSPHSFISERQLNVSEDMLESEERASPLKNFLTIAIVIAAAGGFIGLSWYAYHSNSKPSSIEELPIIKAETTPTKVKPDDPGGMVVPNMDKTIYDNLSSKENNGSTPPPVARILPGPEEPLNKTDVMEAAPSSEMVPDASPAEHDRIIAPTAEVNPSLPSSRTEMAPAVEIPAEPALPQEKSSKEKPLTVSDIKSVPATKEAAKISSKGAKLSGYRIQLASFKTESDATSTWKMLKKKHQPLVGKLHSFIERKDLGSKGVFYRLQAGPFRKESEARLLCKKLIEAKQGCIVVRSGSK